MLRRRGRFSFMLTLLPVGYLAATILVGGRTIYLIG